MNRSKITGYAAMTPGEALVPFSYALPSLNKSDVRIDITHCGVCGSDIQAIDDVYSVFKFPFVPGHEIVGYISELGEEVTGHQIGERVGVGWQGRACGECEWCQRGEVQLCMDVIDNGTWSPYGGFSSSIIVQQDFVCALPPDLPSQAAAVLMCAGFTVYTALSRRFDPSSNRIGILGIGGLGHLAIQFAHALGYEVTALSSSTRKQEESIALGADRFINISDRETLEKTAYYFDQLLITSHGGIPWDQMLAMMKKKGRIILAAFPPINFDPVDFVVHELSMEGSFLGKPSEMRAMLQFASDHQIKPMIEVMQMSQINQAIDRLRQNQAHYRIVLENDIGL